MMQKYYFSVASGLVLALSVWGFSDNLIWNVGQPSNREPMFVVHGLFCLAWMVALFVQATLVRTGRIRLHRKVGIAGFAAAIGVTVSTVYVFVAVWRPWETMPFYVQANRLLLPSFALLVLLGFLERKRPDRHKRYLFVATLYMMEPILSRAFDPIEPLLSGWSDSQIDHAWQVFFVLTWNGLFLSLFAYDWAVARRIHPVTIGGFAWFCAIWAIVLVA